MKKFRQLAFFFLLFLCIVSCACSFWGVGNKVSSIDIDESDSTFFYHEMSKEEEKIAEMLIGYDAVEYGVYDYHLGKATEGFTIRVAVYQEGGLISDQLIHGIKLGNPKYKSGILSLVIGEENIQVKIKGQSEEMTCSVKPIQMIKTTEAKNGGSRSSFRGGELDENRKLVIFLKGLFDGADPGERIMETGNPEEISKKFSSCIEIYIQGY